MDEDEDGKCVRFFQWIDDGGHYSEESIMARLIDNKTRRIRRVATSDAIPKSFKQAELNRLPDLKTVEVKWFVPVGGVQYRYAARVMPRVRITCKDHFREELEKHLKKRKTDPAEYSQILTTYDKDPVAFREELKKKLEGHVDESDVIYPAVTNPIGAIPTFILNRHYHVLFDIPLPASTQDRSNFALGRLREMVTTQQVILSPVARLDAKLDKHPYATLKIHLSQIMENWPDRVLQEFLHVLHHDFFLVCDHVEIKAQYEKFKELIKYAIDCQ